MAIDYLLLNVFVAALWAAFTVGCVRYVKRKVRSQAVKEVVEIYGKGLVRFANSASKTCPQCAYACDGYLCEKADVYNFVRFGKCTNFEEKRY